MRFLGVQPTAANGANRAAKGVFTALPYKPMNVAEAFSPLAKNHFL